MLLKRNRARSLGQLERLFILVVYVGLFLLVSLILDGRLPSFGNQGIWFYSCAVTVFLVSLLVTPFSDRPVDIVSSAVAAILTLLITNTWEAESSSYADRIVWAVITSYVLFVLVIALLAITFYNFEASEKRRITRSFYSGATILGTPALIFSAVFSFAVFTFHRHSVREWVILGSAWLILVLLCPVEVIWRKFKKVTGLDKKFHKSKRIGYVTAHKSPNIILVNIDAEQNVQFGEILVARNELDEPSYAMALDYVGYSKGRWLRAYIISTLSITGSAVDAVGKKQINRGNVYKADIGNLGVIEQKEVSDLEDRIIGLVSSNSIPGMIRIELVRSDKEIRQGSVFELCLSDENIIEYQVVEGVTQEEIIEKKNTHGYVFAKAKLIGSWSEEDERYSAYSWVPNQNQIIKMSKSDIEQLDQKFIGYVSHTSNGVSLDLNEFVTHNAAILGVLGSGKSYLALELIERMLRDEVKVICIDSSGEFERELSELYNPQLDIDLINHITEIGPAGKKQYKYIKEEGGSIIPFEKALKDSYDESLSENSDTMLRIFDPSKFEVWAQKSWMYNNNMATMAQLTYPEIVSKLTMVILQIAKQSGMTKTGKYCIVFEEAHSLIPEFGSGLSTDDKSAVAATSSAIVQGRKFGLGCLVVTQRTANDAKTILNQCNTIFCLRVFDDTAMSFLENYFGKDYVSSLPSLQDRHAILYGLASSCQVPIQIKLNEREDFIRMFRQCQTDYAT